MNKEHTEQKHSSPKVGKFYWQKYLRKKEIQITHQLIPFNNLLFGDWFSFRFNQAEEKVLNRLVHTFHSLPINANDFYVNQYGIRIYIVAKRSRTCKAFYQQTMWLQNFDFSSSLVPALLLFVFSDMYRCWVISNILQFEIFVKLCKSP